MPRKNLSLPEGITQQPNGRYRWRATVGQRNGKQVRLSGTTKTQREAKTARAKAITDHDRGVLSMPDRTTVQEYAERWLNQQRNLRPNTCKMYKTELGYVLPLIGHHKLKELRSTHIKDALIDLSKRVMGKRDAQGNPPINAQPMSTRTLAMVRGRLRSLLTEAVNEQLIYVNPAAGVKRVTSSKESDGQRAGIALDHDQSNRLRDLGEALYEAGGCRLWNAVFTALSIGLRRGEVMGLRWQDVNLETNTIHVRQNLTDVDGQPQLGSPKTPQSIRDIPIPPSLRLTLERQRRAMLNEASIRGETLCEESPVFATTLGGYTHPSNLSRAVASLVTWSNSQSKANVDRKRSGVARRTLNVTRAELDRKLKSVELSHRPRIAAIIHGGQPLPKISPHDLRHTFATLWLRHRGGQDVARLSKILGHTKVSVTLDIYRHVLESELQSSVVDLF